MIASYKLVNASLHLKILNFFFFFFIKIYEFINVPVKCFKRAKLQNNLGEGPSTENDTKHSISKVFL